MPIKLYIGGVKDSTIPTNGNVVKILGPNPGFFYTDANHDGAVSPTGEGTTRAGFHDDYYYMVADPHTVNTGMQIKPSGAPSNNFCGPIECDSVGCAQAFTQPPTSFGPSASNPPAPPYYRCPVAGTSYDITFCPTGALPDQGKPIYFNGQKKCLTVQGGVFADGTPVQIYDCYGTQRQRWVINRGGTKVQLAGTNFCLDAGSESINGSQLKIGQCNNIPEQQWNYTGNNHVVVQNRVLCMDLENGITTNSNKVQTWECSDSNTNQVWTL